MFWRNLTGLAPIACLVAMAINLTTGAYVYPMRPHSIDPLLMGGSNGGGAVGGQHMPQKRPFCNAFTGCGRKRSDPDMSATIGQQLMAAPLQPHSAPMRQTATNGEQLQHQQQRAQNPPQPNAANGFDDTLVDLLDLNSEPAIEDLMRQIMSQAKMWEAIQEANREMIMQKNDRNAVLDEQSPRVSFPTVAFNSQ